ncbi:MAG: YicC family protein [Firmicutes bacterium]|nr:YicC family protein [Bacillota bacterium]
MIKSMTGYGRSKYEANSREYLVEIKSVNNRYNDVSIKMTRTISYLEEKVNKVITGSISRGKIDVYVGFTNNSDKGKKVILNEELAKAYVKELKKLTQNEDIVDDISAVEISKLPDVFTIRTEEDDEEVIWQEVSVCLNEAIGNLIEMREVEGKKIKEDLAKRIKTVSEQVDKICEISAGLVNEYIVKLEKRINELLKDKTIVDEARLAQEVVIYSDKSSIEEEITRLKSHISQFLGLLDEDEAVGKKLDFLMQEMNREANTIGSKANSLEITKLVVDVKTELENIREQVQNIE